MLKRLKMNGNIWILILLICVPLFLAVFNSCKPDEEEEEFFLSCGTITDQRNGHQYETVQIGNQCWMAENLNVGIMIDGNLDQTDNDTIEKYCYNNNPANCDKYGALYQWDELMQYSTTEQIQGICPEGWYVPSDGDWKELEITLGMSQTDAEKENAWRGQGVGAALKIGGKTGFDVLISGQRSSNGSFDQIEGSEYQFAYFHTSSEAEIDYFSWRRCLRTDYSSIGRYDTFSKKNGFSLRCIRYNDNY